MSSRSVRVQLVLPAARHALLVAEAKRLDTTVSALIRQHLAQGMDGSSPTKPAAPAPMEQQWEAELDLEQDGD